MNVYFRPLVQNGTCRPDGAVLLAGGPLWFTHAEKMSRQKRGEIVRATKIPAPVLDRLSRPRKSIAGLSFDRPNIMGILNVTPDSFSDGGAYDVPSVALQHAREMVAHGADILDVGGESTRPYADFVSGEDEIGRTVPVIKAIRQVIDTPISIDTRKSEVARKTIEAGANFINDVSAFTYDPEMAAVAEDSGAGICLMHAQGDPATMQDEPSYDNVLLDVYDFLEDRIRHAVECGVKRDHIMIDPGIGFGKNMSHSIKLLQSLSLFHGLGCVILLGVSRKRFIGELSGVSEAKSRVSGSIAVALAAVAQGAQVLRVHDVSETKQAINLWQAVNEGML